jgi:Ca-activated chloride channel family protein
MISFASPLWLFLLVFPAILLHWVWTRTTGRIAFPFDHVVTKPPRIWPVILKLAESLPALLLAVVIVILAGPQQTGIPQTKRSLTNIEFCVDVSGSMSAKFGELTRYDESMKAINQFLDYREGDAFGLTFFGNAVVHWTPLTTDTSAIKCAPPFMHPDKPNRPYWFGGTEVGKALLSCRDVLRARPEGDRLIILVSDGESADLYGERAEEIAALLSKDGITVLDIHVAGGEVPADILTITTLTGGEAFQPGDPETLRRVFEKIDKMVPAKMERTVGELMDNFTPFCIAALAIMGVFQLTLFNWRYTPW